MEPVYKLTNAESKLAERDFDWKKSTTFTVLKLLIQKGIAGDYRRGGDSGRGVECGTFD